MMERGVITVALILAIVVSASGEQTGLTGSAGGYTWEFTLKDDNTAELYSCSPEQSGKLYLPETIIYHEQILVNGELVTRDRPVNVTSIDGTFTCHTDIKDVTIPEFIKYIGVSTFGCCPITNLVILGDCYIHGDAFPSCELESVSFSDNVVFSWGNYFNVANKRLIDFTSIPGVTLLDGYVMPCHTNNVPIEWHLPSTLDLSQARGLAGFALSSYSTDESTGGPDPVETIILPSNIVNLPPEAFDGLPNLKTIDFGRNSKLKHIYQMAFCECPKLKEVKLPSGLETLDYLQVAGSGVEKISLPASLKSLSLNAFRWCESLSEIVFEGNAPKLVYDNGQGRGETWFYGFDEDTTIFNNVNDTCVVYVPRGSSGWGTIIPGTWHGLRIEYSDSVLQPQTHTVTFDLGEHGVRAGGGELMQTVTNEYPAVAPLVAIKQEENGWWRFTGWDVSIASITSNAVVNAVYVECVPDDAVLYVYNKWEILGDSIEKVLGWTFRPAPPHDWAWTNITFQGKERLRDTWEDIAYDAPANYCRAIMQIESAVNGATTTKTLVSRNVLFECAPADDADARDWSAELSAGLTAMEIMNGGASLIITNGQTVCFEYVLYNSIYPVVTHYGMVSAIITTPDEKSDCIGIDAEGNIGFLWWTAPDMAGQYTLSYIDETSGQTIGTCQIIVVSDSTALPPLPNNATAAEVAAALDGAADAGLTANVTNAAQYASFREWALSVTNGMTTAQSIIDSSKTWLSYALGADALIGKEIVSNDIHVVSFGVDGGGLGANDLANLSFEVSIDGVNIGGGAIETETLKENLKKVLGLEGAATLAPNTFTSDNIEITFDTPADGRARFTATPPANVGNSFFMRVKVK